MHLAIPKLRRADKKAPEKVGAALPSLSSLPTIRRNLNDSNAVRERGLEPPHLAIPDPKSGASTSSATRALSGV